MAGRFSWAEKKLSHLWALRWNLYKSIISNVSWTGLESLSLKTSFSSLYWVLTSKSQMAEISRIKRCLHPVWFMNIRYQNSVNKCFFKTGFKIELLGGKKMVSDIYFISSSVKFRQDLASKIGHTWSGWLPSGRKNPVVHLILWQLVLNNWV